MILITHKNLVVPLLRAGPRATALAPTADRTLMMRSFLFAKKVSADLILIFKSKFRNKQRRELLGTIQRGISELVFLMIFSAMLLIRILRVNLGRFLSNLRIYSNLQLVKEN